MTGLQANPLFMTAIENPGATMLGTVVAAQSMGAIPAYVPGAMLSDKFGRKAIMSLAYVVIIAGALVQTFTTGPWKLFGGRFIVGFGGSLANVAGGPYTTEIAHPRNRAQTTALIQTCYYIGGIIAAWVTFGAVYMEGTNWSWRMCCLFQIIIPAMALCTIPFIPESPRWLVAKGRFEEAHAILAKYHANGDMEDELVLYELEEIKEAIDLESSAAQSTSYMTFFKTRGNLWRLSIIIVSSPVFFEC
jgi:MFS family permease